MISDYRACVVPESFRGFEEDGVLRIQWMNEVSGV